MSEEQLDPQENPAQPQQPTPAQPQQNQFPPQNGGFGFNMQQSLPNATIILVLGILSIVTCCCYGVIGLILAIVALVLSKKDKALYFANMAYYTESSFKNMNAGRVCAIIGLILNILYLLFSIAVIIMFGFGVLSDQNALKEALQGMQ